MKFFAILLVCFALGSGSAEAADSRKHERSTTEGLVNEKALLACLRPALASSGEVGRLYYSTTCRGKGGEAVPFPRMQVRPPGKGKAGLDAVRDVFKEDKRVVVEKDASGIIRVQLGKPSSKILQTKIGSLTLEPLQQYNPELAIEAILEAREVKSAMETLGLTFPEAVIDMNVVEAAEGLPHLSDSLRNKTVDEALDLIAQTFGGIVYYGACDEPTGQHLIWVQFVGVKGVGGESKGSDLHFPQ